MCLKLFASLLRDTRHATRLLSIAFPLLLIWTAGCSSTGYLAARGRDAADIFTFTVGAGDGAKVRVGPLQVAAVKNADLVGLRGGEFFADGDGLVMNDERYAPLPLFGVRNRYSRRERLRRALATGRPMKQGEQEQSSSGEARLEQNWITSRSKWTRLFGEEGFSHGLNSVSSRRNKNVLAKSPAPIVAIGATAPYYTQIEIVAGLLLTVRAGVNPGELLDFLLGWTGIDIYGDDSHSSVSSFARETPSN